MLSQLRRDEEILVDRKPRCLFCRVEMIAASDYSELWMSPYIAIKRMATISETYGVERARTDRRFKKEREAWTTGALALALSKLKDEEWWVETETVDNASIQVSSGDAIFFRLRSYVEVGEPTVEDDRFGLVYPDGRFEVRRFRPNIVVETAYGDRDFAENAWIAQVLAIGDTVRLSATGPCPRCVSPKFMLLPFEGRPALTGQVRKKCMYGDSGFG